MGGSCDHHSSSSQKNIITIYRKLWYIVFMENTQYLLIPKFKASKGSPNANWMSDSQDGFPSTCFYAHFQFEYKKNCECKHWKFQKILKYCKNVEKYMVYREKQNATKCNGNRLRLRLRINHDVHEACDRNIHWIRSAGETKYSYRRKHQICVERWGDCNAPQVKTSFIVWGLTGAHLIMSSCCALFFCNNLMMGELVPPDM